MSFNILEISNYDGAPISLYEFHRTSGATPTEFYWRYNSSDRDVTWDSNVYAATTISDDGVKQTGEATSSELVITMPVIETLPQTFIGGSVPSDVVYITIRRVHFNDGEARVFWVGTIVGLSQTDEVTAKLTCSTLVASFKRGGLRLGWTRGCPYVLYDLQTCKADRNAFVTPATVTGLSGVTLNAAEFALKPDGWFAGGFVEWLDPSGTTERRAISAHAGDLIQTIGPITGVVIGDGVNAFAGCQRTRDDCNTKFVNLPNHGGFPHTPGKSPFNGDPVF